MDHHFPKPPHLQPKRARAVIINGVELRLKECIKCGMDFYGPLEHSTSDQLTRTRSQFLSAEEWASLAG
jgi:hypothetical protein